LTDPRAGIVVRGVGKRFRRARRADSLRDLLPDAVGRLLRRPGRGRPDDEFWAVRDLSFTVAPGEVLGIIGPNGAGKSTVLRLLTGLLRPDTGSVEVRGRIGALIELAAGFHPDLTGRENVFLQGAILGLTRAQVRQRLDAIVAFAEVEAFLDTPVKHYSSGMNARLGFAVAAHCEPDVLLVDEVLAVGDRAFQAKAYARLLEEVQRGIPVVIVSHQLERVASLCQRGVLLARGGVAFAGDARACVAAYVEGVHLTGGTAPDDCPVVLHALEVEGATPGPRRPGETLVLRMTGSVKDHPGGASGHRPVLGVRLWALPSETRLGSVHAPAEALALPSAGPFAAKVEVTLNLGPGTYRLQTAAWHPETGLEWGHGPSQVIEVEGVAGSAGDLWLAPRFYPSDG